MKARKRKPLPEKAVITLDTPFRDPAFAGYLWNKPVSALEAAHGTKTLRDAFTLGYGKILRTKGIGRKGLKYFHELISSMTGKRAKTLWDIIDEAHACEAKEHEEQKRVVTLQATMTVVFYANEYTLPELQDMLEKLVVAPAKDGRHMYIVREEVKSEG
jgi:hypothetical protein